jgi:Ca-activated chloride channel family protein
MRNILFLLLVTLFSALTLFAQAPGGTEGRLFASDKQGPLGFCPLKTTKVRADISGFFARVTVVQEFENTYGDPIEAVYTFPLSQNSAVDSMTMTIGERVIRGKIMKREEARKVYEAAKSAGQTASLLDQQRPNIFTQSVANIMPGEKITVEISYVETLKYEEGSYEFNFPMVVGPRYTPSTMKPGEAAKINPPVSATRAGHDISIEVNLDAGIPIEQVRSISHEIESTPLGAESRKITLKGLRTIPNKDFILRYDVAGQKIQDAMLMHRSAKGGFFTMMLQPPDSFAPKDVTPKEIVFVLDTSGSMSGFPIEKAKEAMKLSLDGLNPQDTFNVITFSGDTSILFEAPVSATEDNLAKARDFLATRRGAGGTEMMKAVTAALAPSESQRHVRIACFMTDGFVGNDTAIIAEIQKYSNARIFAFGIGNSVNRFLLDKMAYEGRGEVEYVTLKDDGSKAAQRFHERVRNPLLTDISVDWGKFGVSDVYPGRQPDLFSAKPVALTGRFSKAGYGSVTLKGTMAGLPYQRDIPVNFPESETDNQALATIWARARVDELMSKYYRAKDAAEKTVLENEITQLGLEFRLLTQFTSFVAVEEKVVNQDGKMVKVEVPVHLAEGTFGSGIASGKGLANSASGGVPALFYSLPANGRSFQDLTTLTPGTAAGSGSGDLAAGRSSGEPRNVSPTVSRSSVPESSGAPDGVQGQPASGGAGIINLILSRIETHQKALTSLRADVKMSEFTKGVEEIDIREGKMIHLPAKGNVSTRIDWKKPVEESFSTINGAYMLYRPKQGQVVMGKSSDNPVNFALALPSMQRPTLTGSFNINYIGIEEVSPGNPAWHIELVPKNPTVYKSIHLWIDKNGMAVQEKLVETNEDSITLLFTNVEKNVVLKAEDFKIEYPKETKVVRAGEPVSMSKVAAPEEALVQACLMLPIYVNDPLELVGMPFGVYGKPVK